MTGLSSISSSKRRVPNGAADGAWPATALIVMVVLAGVEAVLRLSGYKPAHDDTAIWHRFWYERYTASWLIIGDSRVKSAIDPLEWSQETHERAPLQLAVVATSPQPLLKALAEDQQFGGNVLVGITPLLTADRAERSAELLLVENEATRASPARHWETTIRAMIPGLAIRWPQAPNLALTSLWAFVKGDGPEPLYAQTRGDRFLVLNPTSLDTAHDLARQVPGRSDNADAMFDLLADMDEQSIGEDMRRDNRLETDAREQRLAHDESRSDAIDRMSSQASQIQSRGGVVVFVLFLGCSTDGTYATPSDLLDTYFGALAANDVLVLDAHDRRYFSALRCFDGTHLGVSEARVFTKELARAIQYVVEKQESEADR